MLYLVSLLFAPPILHATNHFLDGEVFLFTWGGGGGGGVLGMTLVSTPLRIWRALRNIVLNFYTKSNPPVQYP